MSLLLANIKSVQATSVYYFGQFVGLLPACDTQSRAAIIQVCCNIGVSIEELSVHFGASRKLRRAIDAERKGDEKVSILVPSSLERLVNKKMPLKSGKLEEHP